MITFLLGPYGHGKSTYIIEKIRQDTVGKHPSMLIVPEQQTVISERELATTLPPSAQLYTEATNLSRLANSVFRKHGGLKYSYITKSEKNLIMYRAICKVRSSLTQYKIPIGREKSCIGLFLQAIGELKSYSVSIQELELASERLDDPILKARLSDMIIIWSAYEKLLRNSYDDPYDDLLMLEKKLAEHDYFKGYNVYFDSFYGFTKSQLNVVYRIIESAENVTIALDCPFDADEHSIQYKRIVATKKVLMDRCRRLKRDYEIVPFTTDYKHRSEDLRFLCRSIWNFDAEPKDSCEDITLALANDEFEECEFVASKIKELVLKGERYSDIAVISRSISSYQGIVDYCFDKYDIPYYISSPSKLMTKPVIKMVHSALNALSGMKGEDIIRYAKCGYCDFSEEELNDFERYIYRWGIYGKKFKDIDYWSANPDGYIKGLTQAQSDTLTRVLRVRDSILEKLSILEAPFSKDGNVRECAIAVYKFLEAHGIKDKLRREIAQETSEEAQELSQVWGALMSALNAIVQVCGDEVCDIESFITLLSYTMIDVKIGSIPTGEDNITIADASLVRAKNIKHVFILGVNEGSFPAVIDDSSFFTDSDKIALETVEINLSSTTEEHGDDELLFFKNSLAVSSCSATVTALKTGISGGKKEASIAFSRIAELFPSLKIIDVSSLPLESKIYTRQMAKELYGTSCGPLREAIKSSCNLKDTSRGFVNDSHSISQDDAKQVFGEKLYLSKSRLESFVKCRFNFYCSYVLKLKESEKIKFSSNDIGTLVHAIFEHFLKLDRAQRRDYTDEEIFEIVTRLTDEYTSLVCGARALSRKMRHFFHRLKATVCVFVKSMLEEIRVSKFAPEYFELPINGDGRSAPLPYEFDIGNGASIIMTGIADRVDVYRHNGVTYVKVFDYKTGSYDFSLSNVKNGLDMQMLIYLLAICGMSQSEFKDKLMQLTDTIVPAGLVYLSFNIKHTMADKEIDLASATAEEKEAIAVQDKVTRCGLELDSSELMPDDDRFKLKKKGSYIEQDEFDTIFELVQDTIKTIGLGILSGDASACPMEKEGPCDYCKNSSICRNKRSSRYE
ncbi:MAG: PD-(D/E)XK nuclease family protein [Clostridia bacterium]|nr:PD-(D/E)XK nuclease family protein [Clostridia bacterium]